MYMLFRHLSSVTHEGLGQDAVWSMVASNLETDCLPSVWRRSVSWDFLKTGMVVNDSVEPNLNAMCYLRLFSALDTEDLDLATSFP